MISFFFILGCTCVIVAMVVYGVGVIKERYTAINLLNKIDALLSRHAKGEISDLELYDAFEKLKRRYEGEIK